MVSVAVSTLGCTDIHLLEPGVKINREHYCNTVKVLDIQDSASELCVLTGVGVCWMWAKTLIDS